MDDRQQHVPLGDAEGVGSFVTDLADFLRSHRPHGPLTADATEPAWNGYLLTVACPCGVVFERWVAPATAERDLCLLALRN